MRFSGSMDKKVNLQKRRFKSINGSNILNLVRKSVFFSFNKIGDYRNIKGGRTFLQTFQIRVK